jgi:hypothetical protein
MSELDSEIFELSESFRSRGWIAYQGGGVRKSVGRGENSASRRISSAQ